MNRMDRALRALSEMDDLAAQSSPVHRLCPLAKLVMTVAYILCTVSCGKYDFSRVAVMALYPAAMFPLSGVPVRTCFYKLRFVLPLVLAVGALNPLLDRAPLLHLGAVAVSGGVVSMLTLMGKGVLCLSASFLLAATTSIDALCGALRQLHVPGALVTLLLLTYRYVGVLTGELAVMSDAYALRAPGQRGIHISAWGSFLGQLLLRSMDRAEALYTAMLLRGFAGEFPYAVRRDCRRRDAVCCMACCTLFVLARWLDAAQLLGSLFVR